MAQLKDLTVTGNSVFGGNVTLDHDPTSAMQAATKQYVDNNSGNVAVFTTHTYQASITTPTTTGYDISGTLTSGTYNAIMSAINDSKVPVLIDDEGDFDYDNGVIRTYYYNSHDVNTSPAYIQLVSLPDNDANSDEIWSLCILNGDTFGIKKVSLGGEQIWGKSANNGVYYPLTLDSTNINDGSIVIGMQANAGGVPNIVSTLYSNFIIMSGNSVAITGAVAGATSYSIANASGWALGDGSVEYVKQLLFYSEKAAGAQSPTAVSLSGTTLTLTFASSLNPSNSATYLWYGSKSQNAGAVLIGAGISANSQSSYSQGNRVVNNGSYSLAIGQNVFNSGAASINVGTRHNNTGNMSALFGDRNVNAKKYALLAGQGHNSSSGVDGVAAVGTYSDISSDTAFAVGIGTADDARANAFEVHNVGGATVNGDLILNSTDSTFANPQSLVFNLDGGKTFSFLPTDSGKNVDIGWTYSTGDGAGLGLRSKSHSAAGQFDLFARNSTSGRKSLKGTPAGVLTWADRRVVTGSSVGDVSTPVYIDGNGYPVAITGLDTKKLTTSTLHVSSELGDPTMLNRFDTTRANRLMFLPANQIIIEKTTDGGTTWVDAGVNDANKVALFSEKRPNIAIPLLNGEKSALCGLRVTFTAMKYNVPSGTAETLKYNYWNSNYISAAERYVSLRGMYFWINQAGGTVGIGCKIERAKGNDSTNWGVLYDSDTIPQALSGYSGADYVNFGSNTFGGSTAQTGNFWNYRITFFTRDSSGGTDVPTGQTSAQSIYEIRGYGENYWTASNSFMARDHLYDWDYAKNATFPAKITVGSAPTADMDVATKKYVDDNAGGGGGSNEYILEAPASLYVGASLPVSGTYQDFQDAVTAMQAGKKVYLKIRAEQPRGTLGSSSNYIYQLLSGYDSTGFNFCWWDYFSSSPQLIRVSCSQISSSVYWSISADALTPASGVSF